MENITDACSAVAPLMRAMECIPEDENEENIGGSSTSLFSSITSLKTGTMKPDTSTNDPDSLLQNLKTRLETFLSCGWLSKQEYEQHVDFLSSYDKSSSIGANGESALIELAKELDSIEERKAVEPTPPPQSWGDMFMSTFGVKTSQSNTSSFWSSGNSSIVETNKPLATATNRVVNGATTKSPPTIVYPKDLANVLSEDDVSELFVETCFFARLGFVQPPCCMSCTYKEALKGHIPNLQCSKWVIWRRDANKIFDPSNNADLSQNALVVQCQSARKLITGKLVEEYQWDARKRMLLRRKEMGGS